MGCSCLRNKFCLILWKNFILQKRHWVQSLFEICIIPLILVFLTLTVRILVPQEEAVITEFDPRGFGGTNVPGYTVVMYAPSAEPAVKRMMETMDKNFKESNDKGDTGVCIDFEFRPFPDEKSLLAEFKQNPEFKVDSKTADGDNQGPLLAAVVFEKWEQDELSYTLRFPSDGGSWWTDALYSMSPTFGPRQKSDRKEVPGYRERGFLYLQSQIDAVFIQEQTDSSSALKYPNFDIWLRSYPYPEFAVDLFVEWLPLFFPIVLVLSYSYAVANIARIIAREKERRIKEAMKIMGLPGWIHWTGWLTKGFIFLCIPTILIIIIFKVKVKLGGTNASAAILDHSDGTLIFVFLLVYVFASITFSFLVGSFCSKSNTSSMATSLLFFTTFIPYFWIQDGYLQRSHVAKIGCSIFSNTAMGLGCYVIALFEGYGTGVQWSTMAQGATPDDDMSILLIMVMLLLDGFLYLFLAIYIEAVFPVDYGIPLKWYFPVSPAYWRRGKPTTMAPDSSDNLTENNLYEKEAPGAKVGIKITDLKKVFGKRVAVEEMRLNFYEDQVTALLGHNGSGKSTVLSILSGLYPPTSGEVLVNGFDIEMESRFVHKSMGVCPQHDVLFDEMTVEEHFLFYCVLKSFDKPMQPEIDRMLAILQLENKRKAQVATLSGGMKRKLSVGIAFIGGSRVVVLDEPTAGMDPGARRCTWDLIGREKQGRTIVLSTHFMDEADLLGDRVAVMAHGKVICCGSSLFLKQKYGGGYHLTIVKEPSCKVNLITQLLQKNMPEARVDQNVGTELSYGLPDGKVSSFPALFDELERKKTELGISSYACCVTRLEEVFNRVVEQADKNWTPPQTKADGKSKKSAKVMKDEKLNSKTKVAKPEPAPEWEGAREATAEVDNEAEFHQHAEDAQASSAPPLETAIKEYPRNKGILLLFQQLRAMLVKKWIYALRNHGMFLVQIFLPVLFFLVLSRISNSSSSNLDVKELSPVKLELNLKKYSKPVTTMECSLSPKPSICGDYEEVAKLQSTVEDTKNVKMDDFFLEKFKDRAAATEIDFHSIVGVQVSTYTYVLTTTTTTTTTTTSKTTSTTGTSTTTTTAPSVPSSAAPGTNNKSDLLFGNNALPGRSSRQVREETRDMVKLKGFFNNQPYHGAPVSLNLISNSILRTVKSSAKIKVANHPLPASQVALSRDDLFRARVYNIFLFISATSFVMSLLAVGFIILPIKERVIQSKHLQFDCGAPSPIFWLGHLIFDGIYYAIVCLLIFLILLALPVQLLVNVGGLVVFFIILIMYGWAIIPMTYLFSFLFPTPSTGYVSMFFVYFVSGMVAMTLALFGHLKEVVQFVPNSCLMFATAKVIQAQKECMTKKMECGVMDLLGYETVLTKVEFPPRPSEDLPETGKEIADQLIFLLVDGLVAYAILFFIEFKVVQSLVFLCSKLCGRCCKKKVSPEEDSSKEDSDVVKENERIRKTELKQLFQTDTMILKDLSKTYGKFVAVDRICLGVQHGECFGLLSVNGSGKTTLFRMLTGDARISSGDAYISGKSVKTRMKEIQEQVGYCPHVDALIKEMTGAETIRLYARLRGVKENEIDELIAQFAADLMLEEHINKRCRTYSWGNKRKLSTSLALVGNPPIVFLDEPTAGMDPSARRHLWSSVVKVRELGSSIVVKSQSVEECEALCTRLGILANGKFRCLGTTQHLKNKFGDGFTITAQLKLKLKKQEPLHKAGSSATLNYAEPHEKYHEKPHEPTPHVPEEEGTGEQSSPGAAPPQPWEELLQPLRAFMEKSFPYCQLKDMHPNYVHYHIPAHGAISWPQLFGKMEEAKVQFQLEAYSVGQTSLEQVFLGFSRGASNTEPETTQAAPESTHSSMSII